MLLSFKKYRQLSLVIFHLSVLLAVKFYPDFFVNGQNLSVDKKLQLNQISLFTSKKLKSNKIDLKKPNLNEATYNLVLKLFSPKLLIFC